MIHSSLTYLLAVVWFTSCLVSGQPILVNTHSAYSSLANPAVVDAAIVESHLPEDQMRASHFYRNPKTAAALAESSWFTDKEMPVFEREADKIPREQVFKLFKNAGFLDH